MKEKKKRKTEIDENTIDAFPTIMVCILPTLLYFIIIVITRPFTKPVMSSPSQPPPPAKTAGYNDNWLRGDFRLIRKRWENAAEGSAAEEDFYPFYIFIITILLLLLLFSCEVFIAPADRFVMGLRKHGGHDCSCSRRRRRRRRRWRHGFSLLRFNNNNNILYFTVPRRARESRLETNRHFMLFINPAETCVQCDIL